jgi:signal transduction histidine kinase
MTRVPRFGLRAQIVLSLLLVFALSFALLGAAALQLTRSASEREHARITRVALEALVQALAREDRASDTDLDAAVVAFGERMDVRGVRIERPDGKSLQIGTPLQSKGIAITLPGGERVTVWPSEISARAYAPLANLLLFYVLLTGGAVVVLAYIALTHLIVRPLDRLTLGSELLSQGSLDTRVPEQGAAEVAHLAATFNTMAEQLKRERHALETRLRELEEATTELRATQQQLIHGEKLASVGRLAAGVAHEIGNPLAAILGFAELLRSAEIDPEERQEFLLRIQRETERIHQVIRDLLDFARRDPELEAGQTADVAEAVNDAVSLMRPQKREVGIHVALDPSISLVVGAGQRITQVVLNLLLNALDALDDRGDIWISSASTSDGLCVLSVSDNGPGIAPGMLDQLFEPFATTKPPGKGTGLGLAVSHTLVESMGGRMTAANRPEGGARFEVHLRRA